MADKNIKPEIRFKGFSEDWEKKELKEITGETYGGGTPRTSIEKYWNGNIPWFQSSDLTDGKVSNVFPKKYISKSGLNNSATKIIKKNSIAIVTRVGVGKLAIMPFSYATSQDFLSLSKLNIDLYFGIYSIYKKIQGELNAVQGTSIKGITKEELLSKSIFVPSLLDEQEKIGTYLKNIDNLIKLRQRKYDKLVKMKKAMLEKMFPKNGALVPEIRFKGFSDEWEVRKLGEITDRAQGNDGRMNLPTLTISASRGWLDQRDRFYGNIAGKEQKKYTLLKKGQLSYNHGNSKLAKYGVVFELESFKEALVPRIYHSFKVNKNTFPSFIEYMFATKRPDRELGKLISSGARMDGLLNISYDDFMSIQILVTSLAEQIRIGNFFRNLDNLITLQKQELEKLKTIKKSCLEKMFV